MTTGYEPSGLTTDQTIAGIVEAEGGVREAGRLVRILTHDGWSHAIASIAVVDGSLVLIAGEAIDTHSPAEAKAYAEATEDLR